MSLADKSNYIIQTTQSLSSATAPITVTISNDIELGGVAAFTNASLVFTNTKGTKIERMIGTAAAGTLTISKRGLTQGSTIVESAGLRKSWGAGTIVYVTKLAFDIFDITGDNTIIGKLDFGTTGRVQLPTYVNTAARDLVYTAPVNGDKCYIIGTGEQVYEGGVWSTLGISTPTPNASTIVAGKVQIGSQVEVDAGTDVGGTGAINSVIPSTLQSAITTRTANFLTRTSGGDGSDGALTISSGTTTLTFVNDFVEKNYSSMTISGTAILTASGMGNNGGIAYIKCKGDLTMSGGTIDFSGLGGNEAAQGYDFDFALKSNFGVTGTSGGGGIGGPGGAAYIMRALQNRLGGIKGLVGAGGGLGANLAGTAAAGGRGGALLIIDIGGKLNFTAGVISVAGKAGADGFYFGSGVAASGGGGGGGGIVAGGDGGTAVLGSNGANSIYATGGIGGAVGTACNGGGGGGAGGCVIILCSSITSNAGTISAVGGNGGAGNTATAAGVVGGGGGGGAGGIKIVSKSSDF